jgi:hypothetical protein
MFIKNRFYELPENIQSLIYSYDDKYNNIYKECIIILKSRLKDLKLAIDQDFFKTTSPTKRDFKSFINNTKKQININRETGYYYTSLLLINR